MLSKITHHSERLGRSQTGCDPEANPTSQPFDKHELAHLVERRHNDFFTQMMEQHMPMWRQYQQELNSAPLAHANWSY